MDEPTNHLDIGSIEALERMLAGFPEALLLVSRDAALVRATIGICLGIAVRPPRHEMGAHGIKTRLSC